MKTKLIAMLIASVWAVPAISADAPGQSSSGKIIKHEVIAPALTVAFVQSTVVEPVVESVVVAEPVVTLPARPPRPHIKRIPVKREVVPGIGVMPGTKDYFKPIVIRVNGNKTDVIDIAEGFPSRISTPFIDPKVIDQSKNDITAVGQSIYVTPKDNKPFTIFITGSGANDPVLSLTLVPKAIPSQTILMQLDRPEGQLTAVSDEDKPGTDSYTENVRYLLRQVALSKIPQGFADAPLPKSVVSLRGLVVSPLARYSGPHSDIYAYKVEGSGANAVDLQEDSFFQQGVRAVSFFPRSSLLKGESTMVYVLSDKLEQN